MEYAAALVVGVPVKEVVWVLVHFGHDRPSVPGSCFFEIIVSHLHHMILKFVVAPACPPVKRLAVGGKSLVKPDVLPVPARYKVTEPLVCQLVRYQIIACKVKVRPFVVQRVERQSSAARVFHAAIEEILHHHLRVFFIRVFYAKILFKELDHLGRLVKRPWRVLLSFRRDIVLQSALFYLRVLAHNYRSKVGRVRV